jgi:bifunctional UDP-N-acetylglucosamine pyrophosphorylase / glucosamine-1-phosphate N-acetyltransferase
MENTDKINTTKIIVLAGGKGTRMGGDMPKVLTLVKGRPMIKYLLDNIEKSGIDKNPVIIVGYKKDLVIEALDKNKYNFITQEQQLGTGHAVSIAKELLKDKTKNIIVLYGDHPLISADTINKINDIHNKSGKKITMATVVLEDFLDWRHNFQNFSRIIRDEKGKIIKDVQYKDASDEERKIMEVNPCYFCFDADWLWQNLEQIKNDNVQKEYYLTDLIKMATKEGMDIESININGVEALGANTLLELDILGQFLN